MARRRGHTEEHILVALRQAEGGTTVVEVCRQLGITEHTFCAWKRKYAGLGLERVPPNAATVGRKGRPEIDRLLLTGSGRIEQ